MKYYLSTPNRGLVLDPKITWFGDAEYEFEISGKADSNHATDVSNRQSITGTAVFLNGVNIKKKSKQQETSAIHYRGQISSRNYLHSRYEICNAHHQINWTESEEAYDS